MLNTQFALYTKATTIRGRDGNTKEYLELLKKALAVTLPNFDEKALAKHRLSYYEIKIINQLAGYYAEQESENARKRGLRMYKNLAKTMDTYIVDENEKMRMYEAVLYNYSKFLGLSKQYKKTLQVIAEGEKSTQGHARLISLPGFAINRACCTLELGQKQESLPFFALAFYGVVIFAKYGDTDGVRGIFDYVKAHFGIEFDYSEDYLATGLSGIIKNVL